MSTLTSPHDLLHAVPFFVGYHPSNSVVVISLKGDEIGFAMRIDFPEIQTTLLINNMVAHLNHEESDAVLIVFYPPDEDIENQSFDSVEISPSIRDNNSASLQIFSLMREIFLENGVGIREALIVWRESWISLLCRDEKCCPAGGTKMESIDSSRIAAEQVYTGHSLPLASREELAAQLSPLEECQTTSEIYTEIKELESFSGQELTALEKIEAIKLFLDIYSDYSAHGRLEVIAKRELALLAIQVRDLTIRDYLFGVALNSEKSTLASFWFTLMRTLPEGYRAPFAVLYASLMYERGDGALANCALDIALTDQPEYSMAGLLRRAFTSGWPPEAFDEMRKELHPQICHGIFGHTLTKLLKEQE